MGERPTDAPSSAPAERWAPTERAYLETLVNVLPSMVWSATIGVGMDYVSKRWSEFTGLPPEALDQEAIYARVHPDDLQTLLDAVEGFEVGDELVLRFRMQRFDGEWRWVEARQRFIAGPDHEVRAIGATTDIHDRVIAEQEMQRRTELLNQTLDVARLGGFIWYFTPEGVGVQADAWGLLLDIMDVGPERMLNLTGIDDLLDIVHPDDHALVQAEMRRALDPAIGIYNPEHRIFVRGDDGEHTERWIHVFARMQFDDQQRPRELLGVMQDVTARRREEQARLQLQKLEATASLAGGIAHDFGNIVGAIRNAARIGQMEAAAGADTSETLDEIAQAARRAGELVDRLVGFAKPQVPRREELDIAALVDEVSRLAAVARPRNIALRCDCDADLPPICGDAGQLHQVLLNLMTNAAQAIGRNDGTITLRGDQVQTTCGPAVRLRVIDDGPGMPPEVLRRLYDPFFTTRASEGGTGLGLPAVQTIVAAHHGTLDVSSTVGVGTTFSVLLPIDPDGSAGVLVD